MFKRNFKIIGIIVIATIASIGNIPYGFKFATNIGLPSSILIVTGSLFAFTSVISNIALGAYSLFNLTVQQKIINPPILLFISLLSAIPMGLVCYFGYFSILSISLNLCMAIAVTLINAAIGYTAICSLLNEIYSFKNVYTSIDIACRTFGLLIGIMVSLIAYMAAIHGLTGLFLFCGMSQINAFNLACVVGLITWAPYAALYANAMQLTFSKFYSLRRNFFAMFTEIRWLPLLIALGSGTSFAEIAIIFFNPTMNIPFFFKMATTQLFISSCLIPCAFISSSAVNYLALKDLAYLVKNKRI